ncbi:MAG: hypothetical protein AB1721_01475 [Patescibacteria group bacterium]
MKKKLLKLIGLAIFAGAVIFAWQAWAKPLGQTEAPVLPEQAGIYDVPGRPDLKMRVFVYKDKLDSPLGKGSGGGKPPKPSPTPDYVCGLVDPDSSAVVGAAGWHLPSNFVYALNPGSAPGNIGSNLSLITDNSFSVWETALSGQINLIENSAGTDKTRASLDGENIVAWGRTQGTALAVTYIWYYPATGLAVEVDTIMNKKFVWSWTPYDSENICAEANSYDAQNILTHELGHWFGLTDHYSNDYQHNTMYGYGAKAEVKKDTLTTGDAAGVNLIY